MRVARPLGSVWDQAQPRLLGVVGQLLFTVTMTLAAPFVALAIASWLLDRHWLWSAIPAAIAVVVMLTGLVAWLVLRWKLAELREGLRTAEQLEEAFESNARRAEGEFPRG